jgi:hypothetical protein
MTAAIGRRFPPLHKRRLLLGIWRVVARTIGARGSAVQAGARGSENRSIP